MSRVGKLPIAIPAGVEVRLEADVIRVKGPKGSLVLPNSKVVSVRQQDQELLVERTNDSKQSRSHQGLVRSLVANMVAGVSTGFERKLEIHGVGYRAEKQGPFIRFELGYSHPIYFEIPSGVDADVQTTAITLMSADKGLVGQVAAKIRMLRKPEPYKGKGIKYKEEILLRKVGKAG
jgi:large subunit ribosomal protein L6